MPDQPTSLIPLCQSTENPGDLRLSPQGELMRLIKSLTEAQAGLVGLLKTLNASAAHSTPLQVSVSFIINLCAALPPLRSMLMDCTANWGAHFAPTVSTGQEAVRTCPEPSTIAENCNMPHLLAHICSSEEYNLFYSCSSDLLTEMD